jgi:tRNA(Ile2)-agmatinylcytidine synthase
MKLHIGLDDTDSPKGGCTTYIGALLVQRLLAMGAEFIDYPNLIRLNPNVPWKTRGNGAVALRIQCAADAVNGIEEIVFEAVEENSDLTCQNTNPGAVIYPGEVQPALTEFAKRTITSLVELEEALRLIKRFGASALGLKNGRGVIGALAAVGEMLTGDHTYEFLAYRMPENRGSKRRVDADSVFKMDEATTPSTFNNVDPQDHRVLITPHGPDPILFGVRGESPEVVYAAAQMVVTEEPVERWVIYRTNQGTDAHFNGIERISDLRLNHPGVVEGTVLENPEIIQGGHVILKVGDESSSADCAAYEPTKSFRDIVKALIPGDFVRVYGGLKQHQGVQAATLNIEKIEVLRLAPKVIYENPLCPRCGSRMEAMGREQGYRCRKCGLRGQEMTKQQVIIEREIQEGIYLPPPRAQRHLTKPLQRYGREKNGAEVHLIEGWHYP